MDEECCSEYWLIKTTKVNGWFGKRPCRLSLPFQMSTIRDKSSETAKQGRTSIFR